MGHRTPLYDRHIDQNARMVDFGGWDMPVHYGSLLDEHHAVRQDAGIFDVSHMTVIDISGPAARSWLRRLLANDVARMTGERALYTAMLNPDGGIIDDLIVYQLGDSYRLVVNCGTREKDLNWLTLQAEGEDVVINERPELAMLAIQGPRARERLAGLLNGQRGELIAKLKVFGYAEDGEWLIARTGYTGEDGVEIMLPGNDAVVLWAQLIEAGIRPCGLGARDTLRLEAGLNLYGNDMDEATSPLEAGLAWTVSLDDERDFIGRKALMAKQAAGHPVQVGLILREKGVLRAHQKVFTNAGEGEITSGTFSPTLGIAIALARVPAGSEGAVEVEVRNKRLAAEIVQPPFVRHGKAVYTPQ